LVAAGIGLLGLLVAIATIRVRRQDLSGTVPGPQEPTSEHAASEHPASQPGIAQRPEDRAALAAAARPCRLC
jgi:hypothetical protein